MSLESYLSDLLVFDVVSGKHQLFVLGGIYEGIIFGKVQSEKSHRKFILGEKSKRLLRATKKILSKNTHEWYSSKNTKPLIDQGPYFLAAQASAGSCTAALVTGNGKIVNIAVKPTRIYQTGIFYEMSTNCIWNAMVLCIKRVVENINVKNIKGIGFVATTALVCLDERGNPVTASVSRDPKINCILSFDNRSLLETEIINKTHHSRLQYYGDKVSPQLQESKLMWLKNNLLEDCWQKAKHFIELSDFLTWKATGSFSRSSGSLLSKWSYEVTTSGQEGWNSGFFTEIGLTEMVQDEYQKLGTIIQRPGVAIKDGLSENVAKDLGLPAGLPVATSTSETHAGGLGLIGCRADELDNDVTTRLCVVFGTRASSHFIVSHDPVFIKGISGPFKDCILPEMWLNEAGQPTAGSIVDFVVSRHPAFAEIKKHLGPMHIHKYLNKILKLEAQRYKLSARSFLTRNLHVLPDLEGNESPLNDPMIRGMISGLALSSGQVSLALIYLATMQSLAYSTRHIMSSITQYGHPIKSIIIGGDLANNSLFLYLHKDICQKPIISPDESRCKLIGAAILAGMASNHFRDFNEAIHTMSRKGEIHMNNKDKDLIEYHNRKYQVFLKMYEHQLEYRRLMNSDDTK